MKKNSSSCFSHEETDNELTISGTSFFWRYASCGTTMTFQERNDIQDKKGTKYRTIKR